jgi:hypothetical protein
MTTSSIERVGLDLKIVRFERGNQRGDGRRERSVEERKERTREIKAGFAVRGAVGPTVRWTHATRA